MDITRQKNYSDWYQEVIKSADMAENSIVRGCMVIKPWGMGVWERMQRLLDDEIKRTGHDNCYFPLFVPVGLFLKEAAHVDGFAKEMALVTHTRLKIVDGQVKLEGQLEEPLVVRPTSETIIAESFAQWIQSYRDLPVLINQWANVVRWELRPRLFMRTTEFLWQEGHTAHASAEDASSYALRIHTEVYNDFLTSILAVPTLLGIKPPSERFAGATNTMTCEGMMRDGKALQMATSHELGQNFAKAFDIVFQNDAGESAHCFTTSWGASTRMVGGLIMAHGDDNGLVVPPRLAPIQVVILPVREGDEAVDAACAQLAATLEANEVRVTLDKGRGSFGRRTTDWEIKGVPLRLEVGPRDLAEGLVTMVRRDTNEKISVALDAVAGAISHALGAMQADMLAAATARRDDRITTVSTVAEAIEASQNGFARLSWSLVTPEIEKQLKGEALTVRCLQRADGSIPLSDTEDGLTCIIAKSY